MKKILLTTEQKKQNKKIAGKLYRLNFKEQNNLTIKKWRKNNPEKVKKIRKKFKLNNPEKVKIYEKKNKMYNKFKITIREYNEMLLNQNNQCFLCFKTPEENKKALAVDHCHKTGKIRGLLCSKCNLGLGLFNDNVNIMEKAIKYINFNKVN